MPASDQTILSLSPEAEKDLREIKDLLGQQTIGEAFQHAIGMTLFLLRETTINRSDVLLRKKGRFRQVNFDLTRR